MIEKGTSSKACKMNMHEHSLGAHIKLVERNLSGTKTEGPTGGNQQSGTEPQSAERNMYEKWQAGPVRRQPIGTGQQPADGSPPVAGTLRETS